ncbi:MAG TPA: carbohydrate kinase family protein [Usitatibacteraceae bacterium]|nr:carbohydrate kinase family protein [Usitatibacteraceae bacterium]
MSALICGSLAYDTIMVFHGEFKTHILPHQIHILNVAFVVPDMRKEFGGTAGNISYNLKLMGGDPLIMATVGDDFGPYRERLDMLGISRRHIREIEGAFMAQAFITTDLDANQITAFHPGAMASSYLNRVEDADDVEIGIVAPDSRDGMLQHASQFHDLDIPFIFDPGQALPVFSGDELRHFIELADFVAVNDYEARVLEERTGESIAVLAERVQALFVTKGAEGSLIHAEGQQIFVPSVRENRRVDPTGCGDAYRAGMIYGIERGWSWEKIGRLANTMGSIKIEHRGPQGHLPTREEIESRYVSAFGEPLW